MADDKKKKKRERVVTPVGRVSYPALDEPDAYQEGNEPRYKASFLIPQDADLSKLRAAIKKVAMEEYGADVDMRTLKLPFSDGNERDDEFYHGYIVITPKSKHKPGVIGLDKLPMDPKDVYGGCYARANVTPFPYETTVQVETPEGKTVSKKKNGIGLALNSVQFIRDGEKFGGSPEKDFDGAEIEDYFPKEAASGKESYPADEDIW